MELDSKQKVLIAIYTEYQKDLPNMENVTHETLGLDYDVFKVAIEKLDNEGMIRDAIIVHGGNDPKPLHVSLNLCKMTNYGIGYVEKKLELDQTTSGEQKVKEVIEKTAKWGWEQFKDFGAKTLAEMLK
jgi:hypothetical protein